MHPDITKTIAALRVDDKHAAAAAARLARQARQARAGRAAGSLPRPQRLLGRWVPGLPQPA
jgi:hypothetical protein